MNASETLCAWCEVPPEPGQPMIHTCWDDPEDEDDLTALFGDLGEIPLSNDLRYERELSSYLDGRR